MNLTMKEHRVVQALAAYQRQLDKLEKRLSEARRELIVSGCSHPANYVVAYTWEHDNGYGLQRQMIGDRCKLCLAESPWSNNVWNRRL